MQVEHLVHLLDAYTAHTNLKPSTVGVYTVNDGAFFPRLKGGGDCGTRTFHRVLVWFDQNWPEDLEWPREIERPSLRAA